MITPPGSGWAALEALAAAGRVAQRVAKYGKMLERQGHALPQKYISGVVEEESQGLTSTQRRLVTYLTAYAHGFMDGQE